MLQDGIVITQVRNSRDKGPITVELSIGERWRLGPQTWASLGWSTGDELSDSQYQALVDASEHWEIQKKALDLLTRREHSEQELRLKLQQRFGRHSWISTCLQELKSQNFLNDQRFAEMFLRHRINNKLYGPFHFLSEIQTKGISREMATVILEDLADETLWIEKGKLAIEQILRKRSSKENSRSILWNKLYQRGFPSEIIEEILREYSEQSD